MTILRAYTVALKGRTETARVIHAPNPEAARMAYIRAANELGGVILWSDTAVVASKRSTVRPESPTRRSKR